MYFRCISKEACLVLGASVVEDLVPRRRGENLKYEGPFD